MDLICVTYEQAKRLKALDFDVWCRSSYVGKEFVSWMGWGNKFKYIEATSDYPNHPKPKGKVKEQVAAPEAQLVVEWFRKRYDIHSGVMRSGKNGFWHHGDYKDEDGWREWTDLKSYEDVDDCWVALIDHLIELAEREK